MDGKGEIYQTIPRVMAKVGAIGKNRKNQQQNYNFRGIDDLYNALNSAFAEEGLFTVPEVLAGTREERQTKNGGAMFSVTLDVKYRFYAKDGSSVEATVRGEAMDSGDKATNKAMAAAHKYALLQVFAIPTEENGKDTEEHSPETVYRAPKPASVVVDKVDVEDIIAELRLCKSPESLKGCWFMMQQKLKALGEDDLNRVLKVKEEVKAAVMPPPAPTSEGEDPLFTAEGKPQASTNREASELFGGGEEANFGMAKTVELLEKVNKSGSAIGLKNAWNLTMEAQSSGNITDAQVNTIKEAIRLKNPKVLG